MHDNLKKESDKMRLKDKVAIITGGSRGIGKAYATAMAKEGSNIVITDILDPSGTVEEIKKIGVKAFGLTTDVSKEEDCLRMAEETVKKFGKIDILINNAAAYADLTRCPFFEIKLNEWDKAMDVNVKGTFMCVRAVFPYMKKQGKGKIINITSNTVHMGMPNFLHYVTSKGAIIAMTRCLARELGDYGIAVNAVAPGYTMSEVNIQKTPLSSKERLQRRCIKRDQYPEDLVGMIIYLASDDSDFVSGQTIIVDGGDMMI